MTPRVNLLPQAYQRTQARRRRVCLWVGMAAALLGVELCAGFVLHARGGRAREFREAAETARAKTATVKLQMAGPTRESELLAHQLSLAKKLRTTHCWSRLLGAITQAASQRVILTVVSTEPARWTPALSTLAPASTTAKTESGGPVFLAGVNIRGVAANYEELYKFVQGMQAANAFAALNLVDARRDKYMEKNLVSFELQCRW